MSFADHSICVDVNTLREAVALEYLLLGDLRELLEDDLDADNCNWLCAVLDALLDLMPCAIEFKQDGGYLAEVVEEYPNWADQVENLHLQLGTLHTDLHTLRDRITSGEPLPVIAAEVRVDLREWMEQLTAHHRHETRLLHSALNFDCGACD